MQTPAPLYPPTESEPQVITMHTKAGVFIKKTISGTKS